MSKESEYFKDKFRDEIKTEKPIAPIIRFNLERAGFDGYFCFVEGSSDENFYSHTNISILQNERCKYFFRRRDDTDYPELEGKESVLCCYHYITNNPSLGHMRNQCIFIVDFDFDGLNSKYFNLQHDEDKNFTITKYHSIENYYVVSENLRTIFAYYNLTLDAARQFYDMIYNFACEVSEFFALKGSISATYNQKKKKFSEGVTYKKRYEYSDIFRFNFNQSPPYEAELFKTELDAMRAAIANNKYAKDRYRFILCRIQENPPLYIRGHNVYDYFKYYMLQKYNIRIIKDDLNKCISSFNIKIEICTANGDILYSNL